MSESDQKRMLQFVIGLNRSDIVVVVVVESW